METAQALGQVGLPDPGGDPSAQRSMADQWHALARQLRTHADRTTMLIGRSARSGVWDSDAASAVYATASTMADAGQQMAAIADEVAEHLDEHAKHHELILEVFRELALQIVATLAFMAASVLIPPLLAWADAWLTIMAAEGTRALEILAAALRAVVQFLIRARAAIATLSKLALRTERFSIGYGKALYEGGRDVVVDLFSNATTTKIEGKQLQPGDLFLSAALNFGVGVTGGTLAASGIKKVLTGPGVVKLEADGLPKFMSFEDQYKKLVNSLDTRPPPPSDVNPVSAASTLLERLGDVEDLAQDVGVWPGVPGQGADLASEVVQASHVGNKAELDIAVRRFEAWDALQVVREQIAQIDKPSLALDRLTRAEEAARAVGIQVGNLAEGERLAAQLISTAGSHDPEAVSRAVQRFAAWDELQAARERVATAVPLAARLRHTFPLNAWTRSLGKPKNMVEIVLVDGVKDTVKGVTGSAISARIDVARGKASMSGMGSAIGLGAASGAIRGIVKSYASNRWFPKDSIEEALWRISNKGLDKFVRDALKKYVLSHG